MPTRKGRRGSSSCGPPRRFGERSATMTWLAGRVTPPNYTQAAVKNIAFALSAMRKDGRLLRSWKDGEAKLLGYLEDYAMTADACLAVYEATFDRRWLDEARGLADEILRLFWDKEKEVFFDTGADHEQLVVRPRNLFA